MTLKALLGWCAGIIAALLIYWVTGISAATMDLATDVAVLEAILPRIEKRLERIERKLDKVLPSSEGD